MENFPVLALLLRRSRRRRRSHIAISRPNGKIGLMHLHFDLAALAALVAVDSGIVAKAVLATQLLGNPGERLCQLRRVVGLVEMSTSLLSQLMKVFVRSVIVGLGRAGHGSAAIRLVPICLAAIDCL